MADARDSVLRHEAARWAREFSACGLELDRAPADSSPYTELEGVRVLRTAGIPAASGGADIDIRGDRFTMRRAVDRAIIMEELARGDVGVFLSAPGPSMAGLLVDILGTTEQKESFFAPFLARPTWSCFALSEPERGSDAGSLTAWVSVDGDGRLTVSGVKRYIGNAARATAGVVFGRRGKSPLSITSYIVDASRPEFDAKVLDTIGLRAAQISEVDLRDLPIESSAELGVHLPRGKRGILGALQVFDQLRPGVAALALGVAWNAFDVVHTELAQTRSARLRDRLAVIENELLACRQLIRHAAEKVDADGDGVYASAAKRSACRLAERVTLDLCALLGPTARLDQPRLDKAVRDARGIEFMEGTGNMQLLNVGQSLVKSGVGLLSRDA